MKLSPNSIKVLEARYLRRNSKGDIDENPEELFHRVAKAIASAEEQWADEKEVRMWEEKFYKMMASLHFLPNSPTLMNAGLKNGQLSACFVLPIQDNIKSIFRSLHQAAVIQKSGGGTGFNFSNLRPENSPVSGHQGTAAGPVGFMKIFDAMTNQIKQAGKRRGANMAILNIDHPDIEQFITIKNDGRTLSNFNLSVGITDKFMQAVNDADKWHLKHPFGTQTKVVDALILWNEMVQSAWKTGDPGLVFLDTIEKLNPTPGVGKITATNPCGEMPLLDYESCNLGSINLSKMVRQSNGNYTIDWTLIDETVALAVRFLDDVIDVNYYAIKKLGQMTMGNRKIGLGVMGWAEMLILLKIPYASDQALDLGGKIMSRIKDISKNTSKELAKIKGKFPNWNKSIHYKKTPLRNATTTSIAPTGSISIIANTSSSIEPLYALAFQRHILDGKILKEINSYALKYLNDYGLDSDSMRDTIVARGSMKDIDELPEKLKNLFLTANEIPFDYHLAHQEVFQKFTDNAVSKTINLANTVSEKVIDKIYHSAWERRLKGITIYRSGSKKFQVLNTGKTENVRELQANSVR